MSFALPDDDERHEAALHHRPRPIPESNSNGIFTLVAVVIALAIAGIAILNAQTDELHREARDRAVDRVEEICRP